MLRIPTCLRWFGFWISNLGKRNFDIYTSVQDSKENGKLVMDIDSILTPFKFWIYLKKKGLKLYSSNNSLAHQDLHFGFSFRWTCRCLTLSKRKISVRPWSSSTRIKVYTNRRVPENFGKDFILQEGMRIVGFEPTRCLHQTRRTNSAKRTFLENIRLKAERLIWISFSTGY